MTKSELRVVVCLLFVFQINAQDTCTAEAEGELSLVTTNINAEVGDLLICEDGVFIGVCSIGFNIPESRAACRQLGFVDGVDDGGTNVENSDFSTKRFRCPSVVLSLTDGSCTITNNTQSCATRARVACSNSYVSTLSLNDGQVFNLPPDMETLMINFDEAIPIGFDEYSEAFVYPTGYMQFGSPPLDYDILSILDDSPPPISLIYPFAPLDGYNVASLTARVFKNPGSPNLEIVSRYVNSNIAIGFTAQLLILTQWTYEDVYIVQSAVVTDYNSTFVVYIYNCTASYQTGGLIGVHINDPGFIDQKFRYSNTPMTSQLACINIPGRNIRFYNLHYLLTEDLNVDSPISPPAPNSDQPFCARFLNSAGCCSDFDDPTTSCASGSGNNTCYCDALCFQRNDCCSDVDLIVTNIEACIPLCIEGTVGLAGNILYSTGPVGVCNSGYMRFISEEGSFIQRISNENTTCLQMYNQINGNFDDFTNEQINMNVYPVYRENVVCSGIEEDIQDCQFIDDIETTDISTHLLTVNCLDAPAPVCINGEITLVQSESIEDDLTTQGIVEICLFGQRQRLCVMDDIVDNVRNLCRFLGFDTTEQSIAFLEDIVSFGITSIDCPDISISVNGCTIEYGSCQDLLILALSCSDDDPLNLVEGSSSFVLATSAIAAIAASVGFTILSCVLVLVTVMITVFVMRRRKGVKSKKSSKKEEELPLDEKRYVSQLPLRRKAESMGSTHLLDDISDELILPNSQLRLLDCVGQGEFGLVYKAHYLRGANADYVAVKTLKGVFDKNEIDDMLKESLFMKKLNHPNVMQLLGVCLDTGTSPYIVLPFMSGGSLLHYLKKYRTDLLEPGEPNTDAEENEIKLLSMCLQVARGMEYIAGQSLVHRDLAARNCMIDHEGTIKVSDFGLSTGLYEKMYFRQEKTDSVKLPIKWMAMESIEDGIFSEKSDVWSFGVTCWEVFSGGKTPFGGIIPFSIPKLLLEGHRLERPYNTACSIRTYQSLMTHCWIESPDNRPQFTDLVQTIDEMLTSMAGYLDFNTFNLNVISNSNDNSKTPIDTEDEAET